MTPILVHFGLHKTGTSTTERTLEMNVARLQSHMQLVTRKSWPEVSQAAKLFSINKKSDALDKFGDTLTKRLVAFKPTDGRAICISNVDLSGEMPGHPAVTDYSALPALIGEVQARVRRHFRASSKLIFMASTRPAKAWLKSLYWQNLKVHRTVLDFTHFADKFQNASDFSEILQQIQKVTGSNPLKITNLQDSCKLPLGPAAPLLTALGFDPKITNGLVQSPRLKPAMPVGIQHTFLEMNRSELSDTELANVKADALSVLNALSMSEVNDV